jgi:hypothetical protein
MECKDCGIELKGGFGVGERPFKEFRCFKCLSNDMHNALGWRNIASADLVPLPPTLRFAGS